VKILAAILQQMASFLNNEELCELLECSICYVVPTAGPIIQCKNGHAVCKSCHARLSLCPSCQEPIDVRAWHLEKFLELMPVPCKFAENGCELKIRYRHRDAHQQKCNKGMVNCPSYPCNRNVNLDLVEEHIKATHEEVFFSNTSHEISSFDIEDTDFNGSVIFQVIQYRLNNVDFYRNFIRTEAGLWVISI
jgi:hypothetical protein